MPSDQTTDEPIGLQATLNRIDEVSGLAQKAFALGDVLTGIAALTMAVQLVQLAKLQKERLP